MESPISSIDLSTIVMPNLCFLYLGSKYTVHNLFSLSLFILDTPTILLLWTAIIVSLVPKNIPGTCFSMNHLVYSGYVVLALIVTNNISLIIGSISMPSLTNLLNE